MTEEALDTAAAELEVVQSAGIMRGHSHSLGHGSEQLGMGLRVVERRAKAQSKLRRLYRWICTRLNRNSQGGPDDVLRGITLPTP